MRNVINENLLIRCGDFFCVIQLLVENLLNDSFKLTGGTSQTERLAFPYGYLKHKKPFIGKKL